jgi:hypothetical protein
MRKPFAERSELDCAFVSDRGLAVKEVDPNAGKSTMKTLDQHKARSESDDTLRMTLLLAVYECHSTLMWSARNRAPVSSGEHGAELRYVPLTPSLLRNMTRTAVALAGLGEDGVRQGQFELIVEEHAITIEVEITGDPDDRVVTLRWGDALRAREAARRALQRMLDLPPPPINFREEDSFAGDETKSRVGGKLLGAWNILLGLIMFTVGLPIVPVVILADRYH